MNDPRAGGHIYIWTLGANKTAHVVAREFGHDNVLGILLDRTPPEMRLALALELGEESLFDELLASRPDLVRTLTHADRRKLVDAAQASNARAVRLMLAAGWPVDARGQHDGTALHWAAWHGNAEMVREILRYRPPIEDRGNEFNSPPIGWAVHGSVNSWRRTTGDYAATVEALLEAGAEAPKFTGDLEASEPVRAVLRERAGGG